MKLSLKNNSISFFVGLFMFVCIFFFISTRAEAMIAVPTFEKLVDSADLTEAYKESYKKRARIEVTNSELKRPHGLGRQRVRGQPAVEMVVFMKVIACNIKRYLRALIERERIRFKDENQRIRSKGTPENAGIGAMGRIFLFSATSTAFEPCLAA